MPKAETLSIPPEEAREPSEILDEEIILTILSEKKVAQWEMAVPSVVDLNYGSKVLTLRVGHFAKGEISTYVENIRGEQSKLPNETSLLYAAASRLMQEIVNERNESMTYHFATKFESMRAWAVDKGRQIFPWAKEYDTHDEKRGGEYHFEVEITPEEINERQL